MKRFACLALSICFASWSTAGDHPPAPQPASGEANAQAAAAHHDGAAARTTAVSPSDAMQRLLDGNDRFRYDESAFPRYGAARRAETFEKGQKPFAAVLACADSRAPVEAIFDQGIGDLFVVRVAGNVSDTDEIGTIEYGVGHLQIPLVVVLGHTKCGAVTAVADRAEMHGHIAKLVDNIAPAVEGVRARDPQAAGGRLIRLSIRANVMQSMHDLLAHSDVVASAVKSGNVKVVGGVYDIQTGAIEWIGPHPREAELIDRETPKGDTAPATAHEKAEDHANQAAPPDAGHGESHGQADGEPHARNDGARQENWKALGGLLAVSTIASGATIHFMYGKRNGAVQ
jgi:carbonic anhydrase